MASSGQRVSASLSSTEPSSPRWMYDVFLSFTGIDTRKGITFELYDGLNRGGIKTFMDDLELQAGAPISPGLLKVIEKSRFAIIVLSPNYASSPWCLEELTKIVGCMKDENRILPLFYHVEPCDVRYQEGSFELAFTKHEATKRHDRETVKQWRHALKTVANFSGWNTQNYKTERELVEAIVESVCNKVRPTEHYKSNLQSLKTKLQDLGAARDEVQHKVDQVKRIGGKRIETSVENWMTRVDAIITDAQIFLKDGRNAQTECLDGFCPNLALCNQLSNESAKLVEEIVQLYGKKEFFNFAYDVLPQEVCLLSTGHYTAFHSRNSIVESVINDLRSPDIEMILVYGIAGVGKTTIVEEVLRQVKHDNLFDDVVMVRDVKENPDLEKIQKEIATKLGLKIDGNHTLVERALKLCDKIKDRRTLVVLDDVWEQIDLMAIGLPRLVNCKLVLTCRSRKDFSMDMRTQKDISLDVLNEKEAWSLFEKMAGGVVKDSSIRSVAIEVARKCGGLPVLIVTIARALKGKNKLHAWNDTLRRLRGLDKKELTKKTYLALEWSYDQLEDKELKLLFLLCGIIVIENNIYLEDLLKYGMGLGLFKNVNTIEEARDLLGTLIDKLIDSCLLLDSDINMHVRMHNLVCEVATQMAFRDQHVLSVGYGHELKEWPHKNFFRRCSKMSLEYNTIPMLSEVPWECPKLEMFYLYSKAVGFHFSAVTSVEIPSNFFSEMEKLKVLGITKLCVQSLPSSLQCLKNLQTLCLEQCTLGELALVGHLSNLEILSFAKSNIEQLPKEIGQLIRLRWLDLSDCDNLEVVSPDVISRLERLEVLTMRNSFHKWEAERGGSNASLLELKLLSHLSALEIYIPNADILPTNLFSNKLVRYQMYIGDAWKKRYSWEKIMAETTLNTLKLKLTTSNESDRGLKILLKSCEDLSLDGTKSVNSIVYQSDIEDFQQLKHLHLQNNVDFTHMIDRKVVFPNLTTLSIHRCGCLRFLFSFSMAQSLVELKHLEVSKCEIMEEIVSTRDQSNEETINNIFCKLESLRLYELPNLARFCTGSDIEFPPVKKFDTELGGSICDPRSSKTVDVKNETAVQNCLFNAQVKFSRLEQLEINGLGKLQTIWNNQLADQEYSFSRLRKVGVSHCSNLMNMFVPIMMGRLNALETLCIEYCDSLEVVFEVGGTDVEERHADTSSPHRLGPFYCQSLGSVTIHMCKRLQKIFPVSVARGLQKLYELGLERCDEVEEIIVSEGLETIPPQFVFPKVKRVTFSHLPKLTRFYPGMHASKWPLLKSLDVYKCDKVKLFAAELPIFCEKHELDPLIEQSLFLIDKDSFPNLEHLRLGVVEIWYGPSPAQFFSKLKSIWFFNCTPFSKQAAVLFLQKLQNLDTLDVRFNDSEEIFMNEEINSGVMASCSSSSVLFSAPPVSPSASSEVPQQQDKEHESLPEELKGLCLYFSLFPSVYEFRKDELVQMWMAEGFIEESQRERMEDIGSAYVNFLHEIGFLVPSRCDSRVDFDSVFSVPAYNPGNLLYKVNPVKLSELVNTTAAVDYFAAVDGNLDGALEMTQYLSLNCKGIDEMTFGILKNFKHLRTLLLLSGHGSSIKHVPRDLFLSLKNLRTLNLSQTLISEVPSSIRNAKSLRYFDLSNTPITRLPESIDSLHHLQTIKLRGCVHFNQFPKGMKKLINLRHIDLDIITQLRAMPPCLGNLTNLQTLSAFLVGREEGYRIGELKNLNDLRGVLRISRLENVSNKEEAEEATLIDKKCLQRLELRWSNVFTEKIEEQEKILECLQPHASLKELQIQHYAGSALPTWISSPYFAELVVLTLYRCTNCQLLPSIGQLRMLKSLSIIEMNEVKEINHQFFRDAPVDQAFHAFPKLEILEIDIMFNLKEWKEVKLGDLPSLLKLTMDSCPELYSLPSLSWLKSLKHLEFRRCPKLLSLPSDGLPTSLESFIVIDCPELKEWCRKVEGEDWSKIYHVPSIWFDCEEAGKIQVLL